MQLCSIYVQHVDRFELKWDSWLSSKYPDSLATTS